MQLLNPSYLDPRSGSIGMPCEHAYPPHVEMMREAREITLTYLTLEKGARRGRHADSVCVDSKLFESIVSERNSLLRNHSSQRIELKSPSALAAEAAAVPAAIATAILSSPPAETSNSLAHCHEHQSCTPSECVEGFSKILPTLASVSLRVPPAPGSATEGSPAAHIHSSSQETTSMEPSSRRVETAVRRIEKGCAMGFRSSAQLPVASNGFFSGYPLRPRGRFSVPLR